MLVKSGQNPGPQRFLGTALIVTVPIFVICSPFRYYHVVRQSVKNLIDNPLDIFRDHRCRCGPKKTTTVFEECLIRSKTQPAPTELIVPIRPQRAPRYG